MTTKAKTTKTAPTKKPPAKSRSSKAPAKPAPKDPLAEAKALIAQQKQARESACTAVIEQVLKQHKCRLSPRIVIIAGQPTDISVEVLALDQ